MSKETNNLLKGILFIILGVVGFYYKESGIFLGLWIGWLTCRLFK